MEPIEPENPWPEPPPPLAADAGAETIETHYVAREPDPRYPPHGAGGYPPHEPPASEEEEFERRAYRVARTRQIIYLILGGLETLLVIRFVLKLLAANPDAAFTSFIYALTEPFVTPFAGVFPTPQTQGTILDLAAVLAMIVYALLVWGIISVVYTLGSRRPAQM